MQKYQSNESNGWNIITEQIFEEQKKVVCPSVPSRLKSCFVCALFSYPNYWKTHQTDVILSATFLSETPKFWGDFRLSGVVKGETMEQIKNRAIQYWSNPVDENHESAEVFAESPIHVSATPMADSGMRIVLEDRKTETELIQKEGKSYS